MIDELLAAPETDDLRTLKKQLPDSSPPRRTAYDEMRESTGAAQARMNEAAQGSVFVL